MSEPGTASTVPALVNPGERIDMTEPSDSVRATKKPTLTQRRTALHVLGWLYEVTEDDGLLRDEISQVRYALGEYGA